MKKNTFPLYELLLPFALIWLGVFLTLLIGSVIASEIYSSTSLFEGNRGAFALALSSLCIFLVPFIFLHQGRRSIALAGARHWRQLKHFTWHGYSFISLFSVVFIGGVVLVGLLGYLSTWIVELLPSSWNIPTGDSVEAEIRKLIVPGVLNKVLLFVAGCLVAGYVEEIFFRGFFQRVLIAWRPQSCHVVIITVALVFALVHGSVVGILPRFAMGLILGYMYYHTRSIVPGIIYHITNNTLSLAWIFYEQGM